MNPIARLALCAALCLSLSLLPTSRATCFVNQMDGYYGNVVGVNTFETDNWAIGTSNTYPNATKLCTGYSVPTFYDNCANQCQTNVTLTTSVETIYNQFAIMIDGWYLAQDGTWKLYSTDPLIDIIGSFVWYADALLIGSTTLIPGTKTPFYTGLNSSTQLTAGSQPPIYQVPFPYWNCVNPLIPGWPIGPSNPIFNYVLMVVSLPSVSVGGCTYKCSPLLSPFVMLRTCNASYPPTHGIVGDPQFTGLRGQDYQVHGIDGGIYNIISDKYMQLNSKFVFLTGPRPCPIIPSTGRKSVACFTHSGSYLGTLALRTNMDDRLIIESGPAASGVALVSFNGETLSVGDTVRFILHDGRQGSLAYGSTHELLLIVGLFRLEIENSDGFLNLRSVQVPGANWDELTKERAHGLLGQTWRLRKDHSAIEGKVDDYLLESEDLFGTDFLYNKFGVRSEVEELTRLQE